MSNINVFMILIKIVQIFNKNHNNKIITVEVKYGKDKNAEKQVRNSMKRYNAEYGIIIGDCELEYEDNILYMPKELFLIL